MVDVLDVGPQGLHYKSCFVGISLMYINDTIEIQFSGFVSLSNTARLKSIL
jgi:hypothetical protein